MRTHPVADLADCLEFRQTLQSRPPAVVHGTVTLLGVLVAAAVIWGALTKADLVVRAPGRVRPVTAPRKVVNAGRGESFSASTGGRVVEVCFREGAQVRKGDVLVRLDTERLDNDITRRKRAIAAGEEELARMARLEGLSARQYEAARAKAEAELAQAREEVRQGKERRASDLRLVELEFKNARDDENQVRRLVRLQALAEVELIKASAKAREAGEKLEKVRLPVDEGRVQILRKAAELMAKDEAVRREEVQIKRGLKQAEVDAARVELANLELEGKQAVLTAPMDGVVILGDVKVGDVLESGKVVAEIAEQKGFRFEALVPSEDVAHLRTGMPARVKLDAYDYQKYGVLEGTLCYVSPDSGVPERPQSGQQTPFYVVRLELQGSEVGRGAQRGPVRLGMAGQVEIVTGQESILRLLVKRIRQTISLG